jgi:WD40 repeat protein
VPLEADTDVNPYRGLEAFEERHAEFFFGRDADVQRLLETLKGTRFLAVLGASGSGKSSLVRAGLVPTLRRADELTEIVILRPGAHPLEALAAQLVRLGGQAPMQRTLDELGADARTLHLAASLALDESAPRLLIVADQFEEVFTLCRDEAERRAFFANLVYAANVPGGCTSVLLALRADFYHRCGAYPELAQQLALGQYLVSPLQPDGLRQAVVEPARRVGLAFEPGLVDTILADVADQPGALPLLEHALLELWQRRTGGTLTLAGYRDSGGVQGAIAKRAEQVFESLGPEQRELARRTFLRLTQPGEGTEDTRRRAQLAELETGGADVAQVLSQLVGARLVTTSRDETGGEVVEVAHEALIRGWPRLRAWLDEDRAGLRIHRRLTEAAREWERLGRDEGALYRGAPLAETVAWAAANDEALNRVEREFLAASRDAEQDELGRARRRARRLRMLAVTLAVLLVAAAATALLAKLKTDEANRQKQAAQVATRRTSALALASDSKLARRVDVALLLALAAYRADPTTSEARSALIGALQQALLRRVDTLLHGNSEYVSDLAFSADGRILVSGAGNGAVRVWDVRARRALGGPSYGERILGVAVSRDGATIAASYYPQTKVQLWDVRAQRSLGQPFPGYGTLAFSPDGRILAGTTGDGVHLRDVRTQKPLGPFLREPADVSALVFSPDGRRLAVAAGGHVRVWDVATHRQVMSAKRDGAIAFAPDGRLLAVADDRFVRVLRADTGRPVGKPLRVLASKAEVDVTGVTFTPNGRALAVALSNRTVHRWDVRTGRHLGATPHPGEGDVVALAPDGRMIAAGAADGLVELDAGPGRPPLDEPLGHVKRGVESLAFFPDGRTLVTGGYDGKLRLWDIRARRELGEPLPADGGIVLAVAVSPDGRTIASAGQNGTLRLWDAPRRRPLGRPLRHQPGSVQSVAFSPDGSTLASEGTGQGGEDVRLWNVRTRRQLGRPLPRRGIVSSLGGLGATVAFSPDGRMLATAGNDRGVRLWNVRTHRELPPVLATGSPPAAMAFSPGGRTLASASGEYDDPTIQLWDVLTHRPLGEPLIGHSAHVANLAFAPDGHTLASVSDDGTLRLWDTRTYQPLGVPLRGNFHGVAFSPDGLTLTTTGGNPDGPGSVTLWQGFLWSSYQEVRDEVCNLVVGRLSASEWAAVAPGLAYSTTCPG